MEKVFIVLSSDADECYGNTVGVKCFGTFEGAKAHFDELVSSFKGSYDDDNEQYCCEESEHSFEWREDGNYCINHYSLTVEEREVL